MRKLYVFLAIFGLAANGGLMAVSELNETFLNQQDFQWSSIGTEWRLGAIHGNGIIGTNFWKSGDSSFRLYMGRVDVKEDRRLLGKSGSADPNYVVGSHLYDEARLPIGYFVFNDSSSANVRLSLWNAESTGAIGNVSYRTYVHATQDVAVFESSAPLSWSFVALKAISPRYAKYSGNYPADYHAHQNPEPYYRAEGKLKCLVQPLYSGVFYIVAWRIDTLKTGVQRLSATVTKAMSVKAALDEAKQNLSYVEDKTTEQLYSAHRAWWNTFWPDGAYVEFPSPGIVGSRSDGLTFTQYYYRNLYKLASAQRWDRQTSDGKKYFVDLQGPWQIDKTNWPAAWFNLNIQLTYSSAVTANRPNMMKNVLDAWWNNRANLAENANHAASPANAQDSAPYGADSMGIGRSASYDMICMLSPASYSTNQYEVGNLTWAFYYWWQYCDFMGDDDEMKNRLYPMLIRAINYYYHIRNKDSSGKYNLPPTASPEYGSGAAGTGNVNYDLSVLRWGLITLLDLNKKFPNATFSDATGNMAAVTPNPTMWQDFLDNLVDYPVDSTRGYKLSASTNFTASHRHYSHLLMFEPLHVMSWDCDLTAKWTANASTDQSTNRANIIKTLNNWKGMTSAFRGYSFTGSSAMFSQMGNGTSAVDYLSKFFTEGTYRVPENSNTLYDEDSMPVIETPLAAVQSLQDMYIQSWPDLYNDQNKVNTGAALGPKIRIFPAVPATWYKCTFKELRASGGFLVSATRSGGNTTSITVKSTKGGPVRIQTGMTSVSSAGGGTVSDTTVYYTTDANGTIASKTVKLVSFASTSAGQTITITGQ